jgi:SAM-dependent methyltransferase
VRPEQLEFLRCPACRAEGSLELHEDERDQREIRTGSLTCRECGHAGTIEDGIVDLLLDPPDFVTREAAGLDQFAETMRKDGWDRERILKLPYEQSGYWFAQAAAMEHLFEIKDFEPGATLLDVGSNTCWASNIFAERGLRVTALDIATTLTQGLRTADWWFDANDVYFERLLSVMFDPALASGTFDYVFCCEVLHHNHRANLKRTLDELFRVLKPGGELIVLNEPLRFLTDLKLDHAEEVAEYEGHEHVYWAPEYVLAARRAGFRVRFMRPNTTTFFRKEPFQLKYETSASDALKAGAKQALRSKRAGRRAYTVFKLLFGTDVSLGMICTKPGRREPPRVAAQEEALSSR